MGERSTEVFAERLCRIVVVDFSAAAQTIWWMLKPFLSPGRLKASLGSPAKPCEVR